LLILLGVGIYQYVNTLFSYESVNLESMYYSLTREVLLIAVAPLYWLLSFLRSDLPKKGIYSNLVLLSWSLALWHGILLGYLDALLRRNGH